MKKIEKFAIAAAVAYAIRPLSTWLFLQWSADLLRSAEPESSISSFIDVRGYVVFISMLAVSLVSAMWLYTEAKRESCSKVAWMVFGLVFQLKGVAIFYVVTVLQELRKRDTASTSAGAQNGE